MFLRLVCGSICVQNRSFPVSGSDAAQYSPGHGTYSIMCVIECRGRFDARRLQTAVQRTAQEIPILTSRYICENGVPVRWEPIEDLPGFVSVRNRPVLEEVALPHAIENSPPLRILLCRAADHDDLLVLLDHVASDARGMFVVLSLIAAAYASRESAVPPQPEDRSFRQLFARYPPETLRPALLPPLYPWKSPLKNCLRPGTPLQIVHRSLNRETFSAVRTFGKNNGATVHDLLTAAFAAALKDFGAAGTVPIESVMDMRPLLGPEAAGWIGNFSANYRTAVSVAGGFPDILRTSAAAGTAFKNGSPAAAALRYLDPAVRTKHGIRIPEDEAGLDLRTPFLSNIGIIPSAAGDFGGQISVRKIWMVTDYPSGSYPSFVAGTWDGELHLAASASTGAALTGELFDRIISILSTF